MQGLTIELAVVIIGTLWFFTTALFTALWQIYIARLKSVEADRDDLKVRVQRIEDVQSGNIDRLEKKLDKLEHEMSELKQYVHEKMHDDANRMQQSADLIKVIWEKLHGSL